MEERFTKGEWSVEIGQNGTGESTLEIYSHEAQSTVCDDIYRLHDAHLMAASKDLYVALKVAVHELELLIPGVDVEVLEKAKNALNKAING